MMSPEVRMQRGLERGTDDRSLQRVPPLVAQIADEVSNDIISGRFKPGERIREQDLADRFGTSRAPVREAIRLLEIEGLIETEHWRGARVVNLSVSQVEDLFEMISAIFGLVARLAARHGSRADFERFSAAVEEMQARHDEGSSGPERVRASFEAARVLREACASPLAGEMLVKLSRLAFIHHRLVQAADDPWQLEALAHWRELAGAVQAGVTTRPSCWRAVSSSRLRSSRSPNCARPNEAPPHRRPSSSRERNPHEVPPHKLADPAFEGDRNAQCHAVLHWRPVDRPD
jgi:DNA-binding GntR family transcriptional regulator